MKLPRAPRPPLLLIGCLLSGSWACSSASPVTPPDAGHDGGGFHVLPDSGTPDATDAGHEAAVDATLSCTPGPVDLTSLPWHPTPTPACSPAQLSNLVQACFGATSTTAECGSAQSSFADVSCVQCIYTPSTAKAWGPTILVSPPGASNLYVPLPNFGGCIAHLDKSVGGQKCAREWQELQECEIGACVARCEVDGVSDLKGREALFGTLSGGSLSGGCFQAADATVCASLSSLTNTDCSNAVVVTGPASVCFQLQSVPGIERMFSEYCGGYVEAGAPPVDGAPPDAAPSDSSGG